MKEKLENKEVEMWRDDLRKLKSSDIYFIDTLNQHEVQSIERFIENLLTQQRQQLDKKHEDTIIFHADGDDVNWMEEKLKEFINNINTNEL